MAKFYENVWTLCRKIPNGKVSTYKEIGKKLGGKGQVYRAVGAALNKNPYSPIVPCHRVVNSNGYVGGFAHGTKKKIKMLEKEGVVVRNNKVDLKRYLFRFLVITY